MYPSDSMQEMSSRMLPSWMHLKNKTSMGGNKTSDCCSDGRIASQKLISVYWLRPCIVAQGIPTDL